MEMLKARSVWSQYADFVADAAGLTGEQRERMILAMLNKPPASRAVQDYVQSLYAKKHAKQGELLEMSGSPDNPAGNAGELLAQVKALDDSVTIFVFNYP